MKKKKKWKNYFLNFKSICLTFFMKKQFISSSLNLSDYILVSFLVPEKATQLAYTLFSAPEMGSFRKTSLEVLQETEKTHQYKDPIFKRTPERKRHYYSLAHGWESNAWMEKMLPYLRKSGSTIIDRCPAHGLSGNEFNITRCIY
jgi:hypothetical protein